jgi:hypothetical protein
VFIAVSLGVPVVESVGSPQAVKAPPDASAAVVINAASGRRMLMAQPYERFDTAAPQDGRIPVHFVKVT